MNDYDYIYKTNPNYGHECHGDKWLSVFLAMKPKTIVDIGCGGNEFCKKLSPRKAIGVDIACTDADIVCSAEQLPLYDKEFDYVTSFDFLEHIEPDKVDAVLKEMSRVSENFFVTVCFKKETCYRTQDNKTLHPSANDYNWWYTKLEEYGHIVDYHIYTEGDKDDHCLFWGHWYE